MATTKSSKLKPFEVVGRVVAIVQVSIEAESFEDAALKAKGLNYSDFITIDGSAIDYSLCISSIQQGDTWKTDDDE